MNREVLSRLEGHAGADRVSLEVNRYDLELETPPFPLAGNPFARLGEAIGDGVGAVTTAAEQLGARPALIGTLATATLDDIDPACALTPSARYTAIDNAARSLRPDGRVEIEGRERLDAMAPGIAIEGLLFSLQIHLEVPPERFAATLNAAHLVAAPIVGACANSPFLLGRSLWDETRIPLFRAVTTDADSERQPPRALLGHGWLTGGPLELFSKHVERYPPMLPICSDEDDPASDTGTPELPELRLHCGSIWQWNRPVYDPAGHGHVRLELRCLPCGPTVADMTANAAFLVGATLAEAERRELPDSIPFESVERNFDAAARHGLDATLEWPTGTGPESRPLTSVVEELLRSAAQALAGAGVERSEADAQLAVIERRLSAGLTGAGWQRRRVGELEERVGRDEAVASMLAELSGRDPLGPPIAG